MDIDDLYRMLEVGERIQKGDEVKRGFEEIFWEPVPKLVIGMEVNINSCYSRAGYRRPLRSWRRITLNAKR